MLRPVVLFIARTLAWRYIAAIAWPITVKQNNFVVIHLETLARASGSVFVKDYRRVTLEA